MYDDQKCKGFSCPFAPLGCSDSRYCPGPPKIPLEDIDLGEFEKESPPTWLVENTGFD